MNVMPELIGQAKMAKSAEELFAFAKENGVDLTEEEAKKYYAQFHADAAVSDDDLEAVSGGFGCSGDEEDDKNDAQSGDGDFGLAGGSNSSRFG